MKKILLAGFLMFSALILHAQIKGTNTVGLGLNFQTSETEQTDYKSEVKSAGFSVGYGYFLKENEKIGINVFYGLNKSSNASGGGTIDPSSWKLNSYGGSFAYQKYYALFKRLYAYAGPRMGYNYTHSSNQSDDQRINTYSLGANGGVSWFFSKRFALEADLLAADISYARLKQSSANSTIKYKSTNFSLNSSGAVNDLGFKIYFLF